MTYNREESLRIRIRDLEKARYALDNEIKNLVAELGALTEGLTSTDKKLVIRDLNGVKREVPWPEPWELRMRKIEAIKAYRQRTGIYLADSKRAIEAALEEQAK